MSVPENLVLSGNIYENYKTFIDSFTNFLSSLADVENFTEKKKILLFLNAIGQEAQLFTLNISLDDPSVSFQIVQDKFKSYCESLKNNHLYHSYKFLTRNQLRNESFDNYLHEVQALAELCDFNSDFKDRLICDKVVAGLYNSNIRDQIFIKGCKNLCDVIAFCKAADESNNTNAIGYNAERFIFKTEPSGSQTDENGNESETMPCSLDILKSEIFSNWEESYDLEKGEITAHSFSGNNSEGNDMNNSESPNFLIENSQTPNIEVKKFEADTEHSTPEEFNVTGLQGDSETLEIDSSQKSADSVEIITINDSTDSDEEVTRPKVNNENNAPNSSRSNKKIRYRQMGLNFPKIKGLSTPSQKKKFYQPQLCDKRFNWNVLKEHQISHKKEKRNLINRLENGRFQCLKCSKTYCQKRSLRNHISMKHDESDSEDSFSNLELKGEVKKEEEIGNKN